MSSNPTEVNSFYSVNCFKGMKMNEKEAEDEQLIFLIVPILG